MSISSPFPYTIKNDPGSVTCVFKLWFGRKYFIYKALKLHQLLESFSAQIHRERQNPKENSILFAVVNYINKSRVTIMEVEVIKESDAQVDILMAEYEALQDAKGDADCLNLTFVNNEKFPHWISQQAVNEFHSRLQGAKMPDKHRNLKRFLNNNLPDTKDKAANVEKFFNYITKNFK